MSWPWRSGITHGYEAMSAMRVLLADDEVAAARRLFSTP
jgi:hypothetical protein